MQYNTINYESESESHSVVSDSLWPHGLYSPWISPGRNTEVGGLSLLQEIFPTQGSNAGFLNCRQILYQLSHKGSPRILEWVAIPFSRGSSQSRDWTSVSYIAGRFFTIWARIKWVKRKPYSFHYNFKLGQFSRFFFLNSEIIVQIWLYPLIQVSLYAQCLSDAW